MFCQYHPPPSHRHTIAVQRGRCARDEPIAELTRTRSGRFDALDEQQRTSVVGGLLMLRVGPRQRAHYDRHCRMALGCLLQGERRQCVVHCRERLLFALRMSA